MEGEKLLIEMKQIQNGGAKLALVTAEQGLEFAKNNNVAFEAAKIALAVAKNVETAVYRSLSELVSAAAGLCNITHISLDGTFSADKAEQKPFDIHIEATILKEHHRMDLKFTPGKTDEFLKSLAAAAIEKVGF